MPKEPIMDLGTMFGGDDKLPEALYPKTFERSDGSKVDVSGKPIPKDVRAVLESGLEIRCGVKYDGKEHDGTRRYLVMAELDWNKHWIETLIIGELPADCLIAIPTDFNLAEHAAYASKMKIVTEHIIPVQIR